MCQDTLFLPFGSVFYKYGEGKLPEEAIYNCHEKFVLVGNKVRICEFKPFANVDSWHITGNSGRWSGNPPRCNVAFYYYNITPCM